MEVNDKAFIELRHLVNYALATMPEKMLTEEILLNATWYNSIVGSSGLVSEEDMTKESIEFVKLMESANHTTEDESEIIGVFQ